MSIKTREAKTADYHQMLDLYKELDEIHRMAYPEIFKEPDGDTRPLEYLQEQIEDDAKYIVVAEIDHHIIGFAECTVVESRTFPVIKKREWVELNSLMVSNNYQGKGVGRILLDCES